MNRSVLPDAELDVISQLWEHGPLTVTRLRELLKERRPLAHTSICTLLGRLEQKGLIEREKASRGKAFVYRAVAKPETQRRMLRDLLDRVFGGSGVAMFASLLDTQTPTVEEISELESLLAEMKKKKKRRRRT